MEQLQDYATKKYQGLCNYMAQDTVGTELTIYGTSGLMLLIAYIKRKPAYLVRQFKKPAHIPERLINERVMQTALVQDIKQVDQDTLLLIKHRPLIPLFTSRKNLLPVKLPGVQVNSNGYAWLQQCVIGREATFIPLNKSKTQDYVVCQLCLMHPPKGNKLLDISETLLKLRFARYAADAAGQATRNTKYYKHLRATEESTNKREAWQMWLAKYPWLNQQLFELKAKLLPKEKLLPVLVR